MHLAAIHLPCNVEVELFDIYVKKTPDYKGMKLAGWQNVEICVQNSLKLTYEHL